MNICTRRWLCHRLKCQARKTSGLTVGWPIISMPLDEGSGIAVTVDYFGPFPITPRGNTYILLSPIVSAAEPTCSQSLQWNLHPRARLIFLSTGIFPSGIPAQHTLGHRSPVFLKAFSCRLQASWGSENCHHLLPPKWHWWVGACDSHDGPSAGNGGQRAPK